MTRDTLGRYTNLVAASQFSCHRVLPSRIRCRMNRPAWRPPPRPPGQSGSSVKVEVLHEPLVPTPPEQAGVNASDGS